MYFRSTLDVFFCHHYTISVQKDWGLYVKISQQKQGLLRHDISLWGQQQQHCTDSPGYVLVGRFLSIPERAVAGTESPVSTPLELQKAPRERERHSFSNSTCCCLKEVGVRFTCWDHTRYSQFILCFITYRLKSHVILNHCLIIECTDYHIT